jgi:hypothetical protein
MWVWPAGFRGEMKKWPLADFYLEKPFSNSKISLNPTQV